MIAKTSAADIEAATSIAIENISEHDRDEMAIPSYLHSNRLIVWLMWRRYETLASYLHSGPDKSVLEFGCGVGLFLEHLCANYQHVYAVDLFPQYAKSLAAKKGISPIFVDQVDDIEDASLDTIVAADVLEHLEDLEEHLARFHRKLKSGGELLVSGPTESVLYKIGRTIAGFGGKGDYHHTNIDNLIDDISAAKFSLHAVSRLPFSWLPCLFKICRFTKYDV